MTKLQPPAVPAAAVRELASASALARYVPALVRALRAALEDIYRALGELRPRRGCILLTFDDAPPAAGFEPAGQVGAFYAWRRS